MLIKMNENKYNKVDVIVFPFDNWLIKKYVKTDYLKSE